MEKKEKDEEKKKREKKGGISRNKREQQIEINVEKKMKTFLSKNKFIEKRRRGRMM